MKNAAFSIEELFRFLDAGVSAFHSTAAAAAILEAEGYVNCPESAAWELAPGGKYYTTRNGSAVLAWRMPKGELTGWHAAASHSDSPTWRIKQFDTEDKVFAKAEVEGYGGMIMPSWQAVCWCAPRAESRVVWSAPTVRWPASPTSASTLAAT